MKRIGIVLGAAACILVGLMVRAAAPAPSAARGDAGALERLNNGQGVVVDQAAASAEGFTPIDLRSIVTLNWKDDPDHGSKGWTRQRENDMRNVQPGLQKLLGIPFDLIDGATNRNRAVLTLKSKRFPAGEESATVNVGAKAASIYFLHASAWTKGRMATYVVNYQDGTNVAIPIVAGDNIDDWWNPKQPKNARVALHALNAQSDDLGLFAFGWNNPAPDKTIKSIDFKSDNQDGIVILTAVTLSDKPVALPDPKDIRLPDYLQSDASLMDPTQWFPIEIKNDPFSPTCIDQLAHLDGPAGKHGFLKTVDGRWVFADGTPTRFVGTMANPPAKKEDAIRLARSLAKYGFTLVRIGHLTDLGLIDKSRPDTQHLDPEFLDHLDFFINELARNGIYSRLSTEWYRRLLKGDDIPDFDAAVAASPPPRGAKKGQPTLSSGGITFFVPRVMDLNLQLEKDLLAHRNPYRNNVAYEDDPAICQFEVTNEDGAFFYTFDSVAPVYGKLLDQQWIAWLKNKYGSEAKLAAAWGDGWRSSDSLTEGHIARKKVFQFDDKVVAGYEARVHDQLEFYASLESGFFNRTRNELRAQGMKQAICGSGWYGVGNSFFPDIWANSQGMDYVDRHHYWGGGPGEWQILQGLPFIYQSALKNPELILKLGSERVIGMPFTISEWANTLPNQWRLEAPGLMAFYGNELGGWDAPMHFAWQDGDTGFDPLLKWMWPVNEASTLCQYPALSQMIRDADLQMGPDVYIRNLSDSQVFSGKASENVAINLSISGPYEAMAKSEGKNPRTLAAIYAAAIGRTGIAFTGKAEKPDFQIDVSKYLDMVKGEIRSATGELYWNYHQGYVTANAPKMQAVIGFATNIPIDLKDCRIQTSNVICSVLVSPLDGQPLSRSRHMLITALGRTRNTGMSYTRGGQRILTLGKTPMLLEGVKGAVTLHRSGSCTVAGLDPYGYKDCDVTPVINGPDIVIPMDGRNKSAYYEITFQ